MKVKPKSFANNVQKYDWDCGVAAVAFLMENKGYKIGWDRLIEELGASEDGGTDLVKIVEFFKKRPGFKARAKDNLSIKDLKKEVEKGRLCLVAYQNWEKPEDVGEPDWGHYGVVVDVGKNKVKLFDPGEKDGVTELSYSEFEKRWYETDLGVYYFRWAMSLD